MYRQGQNLGYVMPSIVADAETKKGVSVHGVCRKGGPRYWLFEVLAISERSFLLGL
jgi:hypothetical protein